MNTALYTSGLKNGWKPFAVFAAVITLYFSVIVTLFDPEMGSVLKELYASMPQLLDAMGMVPEETTLIGFLASYLYGFLVPVFPMVYAIIVANALVAKRVDSGSMATLLAAPVSRRRIVFTQALVLFTGVLLLVAWAACVGLVCSQLFFPGQLEFPRFLWLNLGALALHLFISGVCFFASCLFNESRRSLALGAGLPVLCFVLQMLAQAGEGTTALAYASFFTLFDPQGLITGQASAAWGIAALAVGGLALYTLGGAVFVKKDIPV